MARNSKQAGENKLGCREFRIRRGGKMRPCSFRHRGGERFGV